jgi:hypothetical protein
MVDVALIVVVVAAAAAAAPWSDMMLINKIVYTSWIRFFSWWLINAQAASET